MAGVATEQEQRPITHRPITLSDSQAYTKGPFTAFMAPWNKGSLLINTDYTESFALDPERFPANSLISWNWPSAGARDQVRGFLAIDYGNYYNTIPEMPVQSTRVNGIESLVCKHDLSIAGLVSAFNVIINFFLTSTDCFGAILYEIEIFLHTPNYAKAYIDSIPLIGIFTSASNLRWRVARDPAGIQGPNILFYPLGQADVLVDTIDLKKMLVWLINQGTITGDEFFNGLAVGIEPQQRDGTLKVNSLFVDYG